LNALNSARRWPVILTVVGMGVMAATTLGKACILAAGPYNIDNLHAEAFVVYTNKTMTGAMRGFGAPRGCSSPHPEAR